MELMRSNNFLFIVSIQADSFAAHRWNYNEIKWYRHLVSPNVNETDYYTLVYTQTTADDFWSRSRQYYYYLYNHLWIRKSNIIIYLAFNL